MGSIQYFEKEKLWRFEYRDGASCPFPGGAGIAAGDGDCMACPSFVDVDRDQVKHTTVLRCRGLRDTFFHRRIVDN